VCCVDARAAERKAVPAFLLDKWGAILLKGPSWAIAWFGTPRGIAFNMGLPVASETPADKWTLSPEPFSSGNL
jgi:hypothetical protein